MSPSVDCTNRKRTGRFIPDRIYEITERLIKLGRVEAVRYAHGRGGPGDHKYWEEALKHSEDLNVLADEVVSAVRDRMKNWEKLDFSGLIN